MPNPIVVTWMPQTSGLCGAACAQMILNAKGTAGSGLNVLNTLWVDIKTNTIPPGPNPPGSPTGPCGRFGNQICESCRSPLSPFCWCTHPSALAATINMHLGGGAAAVSTDPSEQVMTARAIASIDNDLAAAVLVHHGTHWVVVHGYLPNILGSGQIATHLRILDSQHQATSLVTMSRWTSSYLTQIRCGTLKGLSVMVGAGRGGMVPLIHVPVPTPHFLAPIIDPGVIGTQAREDAAWLLSTQQWVAALRDATPRPPQLVADLENSGRDYYVVEFRTGDRPTARMIFDAREQKSGEYAGIDEAGDELPPFVPPEDALRAVDGQTVVYRDGSLTIDAARLNAPPTLVWKPCDQSHSAFQPFYRIEQDHAVVYLRVDGVLFPELTTNGAGA